MSTSPTAVAQWMAAQLNKQTGLYQDHAAHQIAAQFGQEFTYMNANGNLAIDRAVLKEFRKLTEGTVVWDRGDRMWRRREEWDTPGRRQAD